MVWLLTEILVFVLAAVVFGGLIGLGLAGANRAGRNSGAADSAGAERIRELEHAQLAIESRAKARAAADAAARGDLETRLVQADAAADALRARAEAAERQLRLLDTPPPPEPVPALEDKSLPEGAVDAEEAAHLRAALAAAEQAKSQAEADLRHVEGERDAARAAAAAMEQDLGQARAGGMQEIESLRAQLDAAERIRAKSEAALAVAHARAVEAMRAAALAGQVSAAAAPSSGPFAALAAEPVGQSDTPAKNAPVRPTGLPAPRNGRPDNLQRIKGIGRNNESVLNSIGIYHFEQIAGLTDANVAWLDSFLKFYGRITREDWVGQARALMQAQSQGRANGNERGAAG
jgi:predicted flap endonuclease-1-like 5' DNA nuclease